MGDDCRKTISVLDEIIALGMENLQLLENELENAKKVKKDIENLREKIRKDLIQRLERIIKDLRIAIDEQSTLLLAKIDNEVLQTENSCKKVISTSTGKLDVVKEFVKLAASILPDENYQFNEKQFADLFLTYKTIEKIKTRPLEDIQPVKINIKYPNTMKLKTECQIFAERITGEIEQNKEF